MKSFPKGILNKYEELKRFHYRTLHELADAAQVLKSCEFLRKTDRQEIAKLRCVLDSARAVCQSEDTNSLLERKKTLQKVIAEYETRS